MSGAVRTRTPSVVVLLIELAVASFVVLLGTVALQTTPVRILAHVALALPLLVWWVGFGIRQPIPLLVPIAGVLTAYSATALLGGSPRGGLETAGIPAVLAAAYGAAYLTGDNPRIRGAVSLAVALAATAWLAAIAGRWVWEKAEWVLLGGGVPPAEPLHHYVWLVGNAVPMLALLTLPFVLALHPGPGRRVVLAVFVPAALLTALLSGGAIALAGIIVAISLFVALRNRRWRMPSLLLAGALTGGMVAVPLLSPVIHELLPGGLEARAILWRQAIAVFMDHPITGTGPATFAVERLSHVPSFASPVLATQGHSAVLQLLAEGGLILAALCVILAAMALTLFVHARRRMTSWHHLTLACIGGLAATLVVESFHELMVLWVLCAILVGWLMRDLAGLAGHAGHAGQMPGQGRMPGQGVARWAVIIATLISVPFVALADAARITSDTAQAAWADEDYDSAAASYATAAALEPDSAAHRLALGLVHAERGDREGARGAYAGAVKLNPYDARASGGLAAVTGDLETRISLLADAAARTESDPQYAWRWARELESIGRIEQATVAYALAVMLEPQWLVEINEAGPVHRSAIADALPRVLARRAQAARVDAEQVTLDVALIMGTLPTDAPAAWRAVDAYRRGDHEEAARLGRQAADTAPLDARSWQALAAVLPCSASARTNALALEERTLNGYRRVSVATSRYGERFYGIVPLGDYQPSSAETPRLRMWPGITIDEHCGAAP